MTISYGRFLDSSHVEWLSFPNQKQFSETIWSVPLQFKSLHV